MRVFLVDDAKSVRSRVRLSVESCGGHVVGEAETQDMAIKNILETAPDIIVVDLQLQEGSGIGVLYSISPLLPKAVSVVLTNHNDIEYQKECRIAGADYFMEKSSQYLEFEALMEKLIQLKFDS